MEHVVFFSEFSGEPAFRRVGDLEAAVRLVESLRNEHGVTDVSLHALTPVPVSFRTYYRVEVGEVGEVGGIDGIDAADVESELSALPAVDVSPVESEQDAAPFEVPFASSPLQLLPPPLDVAPLADESAAPVVAEVLEEFGAELDGADEVADELDGFASSEPLVPLVRPEPEVEPSLGYFAR